THRFKGGQTCPLKHEGFRRRGKPTNPQRRQQIRREAMKFLFSFALFCTFALLTMTVGNTAPEAEWPQWRGPLRNGLSSETGLLKQWTEKGPAVTWSNTNLGEGYGSVAVRGDRIYVQGTSDAKSTVFCLSRANGKTIWSV